MTKARTSSITISLQAAPFSASMNQKLVIGLTGNIGTGKSTVRQYLENMGAFTLDADVLSRQAIEPGTAGYTQVAAHFGSQILDAHGVVDRRALAGIVFEDPHALADLESIVHPIVRQETRRLIGASVRRIIVVEAIKLLESPIRQLCASIWVTTSPSRLQKSRLAHERGMATAALQARMAAQSSQETKTAAADVVLDNSGSLAELWNRTWEEFQHNIPAELRQSVQGYLETEQDSVHIRPAMPADLAASGFETAANAEAMARQASQGGLAIMHDHGSPVGRISWKRIKNELRFEVRFKQDFSKAGAWAAIAMHAEKTARSLLLRECVIVSDQAAYKQSALGKHGFSQAADNGRGNTLMFRKSVSEQS